MLEKSFASDAIMMTIIYIFRTFVFRYIIEYLELPYRDNIVS